MIVIKLLREDVTAVAKKEAAPQPVIGQIVADDMAFVDRGNTEQARAALGARVERIGEGTRWRSRPRAPARPRRGSGTSRRARSTWRCRPACRSCRS